MVKQIETDEKKEHHLHERLHLSGRLEPGQHDLVKNAFLPSTEVST